MFAMLLFDYKVLNFASFPFNDREEHCLNYFEIYSLAIWRNFLLIW